jgi:hypothetical protein
MLDQIDDVLDILYHARIEARREGYRDGLRRIEMAIEQLERLRLKSTGSDPLAIIDELTHLRILFEIPLILEEEKQKVRSA